MRDDGYWSYSEWRHHTIEKIVTVGLELSEKDQADWFRIQIGSAIRQAYDHGLAGAGEDDPITP